MAKCKICGAPVNLAPDGDPRYEPPYVPRKPSLDDIQEIAQENRDAWAGKAFIAIVECEDGYQVHQHSSESVFPSSTYPTARLAVARVMQLLEIGPVAPQTHPEEVCIGKIYGE